MFMHTDTETTGIPIPGAPSDDPRHAHLCSLTGLLDENEHDILAQITTLVQPLPGIRFEDFPEAFRIHGITTERAMAEGMPLQQVIERYVELADGAQTFSAFSAHFDFKILKIACARIAGGDQLRERLERLNSICTMESAAMALIGKKRIKLKEAYFELFHEETQTEQYHGSHADALASRRVFWELKRRGALIEPKATARTYDTPAPEKNAAGEYGIVAPAKRKAGSFRPTTEAQETAPTANVEMPLGAAKRKPAAIG